MSDLQRALDLIDEKGDTDTVDLVIRAFRKEREECLRLAQQADDACSGPCECSVHGMAADLIEGRNDPPPLPSGSDRAASG